MTLIDRKLAEVSKDKLTNPWKLSGKAFAPKEDTAVYILGPESVLMEKLKDRLESRPTKSLPSSLGKSMDALLRKCRHLNIEGWNQNELSKDTYKFVFSDSRVQEYLFKMEEKELLKDLSKCNSSKVLKLYSELMKAEKSGGLDKFISQISKKKL